MVEALVLLLLFLYRDYALVAIGNGQSRYCLYVCNIEENCMTTHQQLLYHIVFSTKSRKRLLVDTIREDVFSYMAGICRNLGGFALDIGGYYDHVHLLVRIPAKVAVSEFVGKLKANTSKHLNETPGGVLGFAWQDGFGAFTVSPSSRDAVSRYVRNQMLHHQQLAFEDEFLELLKRHEVEYDQRYIFD